MCFGDLRSQEGRCYFLLAQKVTKDALGDAFGAHPACGGAHRRLAPKPPFYERGPLRLGSSFRRAKSRSVSVLFSAHWGLMPSKFAGRYLLSHTAWCVPTCLVRQSSGRSPTTAQLSWLCQCRRCPYSADTLNFHPAGPSGPRQEGRKVLFSEPPDASAYLPGGRPPVNGVRGKPPMSARCAKALIEGGPGDSLVTF